MLRIISTALLTVCLLGFVFASGGAAGAQSSLVGGGGMQINSEPGADQPTAITVDLTWEGVDYSTNCYGGGFANPYWTDTEGTDVWWDDFVGAWVVDAVFLDGESVGYAYGPVVVDTYTNGAVVTIFEW